MFEIPTAPGLQRCVERIRCVSVIGTKEVDILRLIREDVGLLHTFDSVANLLWGLYARQLRLRHGVDIVVCESADILLVLLLCLLVLGHD